MKIKTTNEGGRKTDKATKIKQETGGRGWGRVVTSGGAKEGSRITRGGENTNTS